MELSSISGAQWRDQEACLGGGGGGGRGGGGCWRGCSTRFVQRGGIAFQNMAVELEGGDNKTGFAAGRRTTKHSATLEWLLSWHQLNLQQSPDSRAWWGGRLIAVFFACFYSLAFIFPLGRRSAWEVSGGKRSIDAIITTHQRQQTV